ncbi:GerAB/ArcD/ProY family transporter [Alkaliphilus serpentinus]|uniref:GerAB/ArcD/ProY family transporter n=1 Tax=Alkaliphilus serpentinus TaxID=1482731 RepID=A0A833HLF1_9FIRM|nr:endospore germination permease [Alkaliphilus serpentinus]KAB3525721.1 GerAB/ArcD/ProY family transporter [Alkaliphilus serpentinus]
MLSDKKKISTRQIIIIFIVMVYSPAIRVIPAYTSEQAKQAAWITPLIAFLGLLIIFYGLQKTFQKYKDASLMEVIYDIIGTFTGKIIVSAYIVWITLLAALYVRYYSQRIVTSIFPNVDIRLFIIVMLVFVAYTSRYGVVVLARMNEIIFTIIAAIFVIFVLFLSPKLEIQNLTPISYLDIMPVLKGSLVIIAVWVYAIFLFMLSDQINDKENIKKFGIQASFFLLVINVLIIAVTVGTLGHTVSARMPLPFLSAVKQISFLDTLEKIESILVVTWIASDFTLISILLYVILNMVKSVFNFQDTKPFINVLCLFLFILSLYLTESSFELAEFSTKIALPVNLILGLAIPVLLFIVGKVRKKI